MPMQRLVWHTAFWFGSWPIRRLKAVCAPAILSVFVLLIFWNRQANHLEPPGLRGSSTLNAVVATPSSSEANVAARAVGIASVVALPAGAGDQMTAEQVAAVAEEKRLVAAHAAIQAVRRPAINHKLTCEADIGLLNSRFSAEVCFWLRIQLQLHNDALCLTPGHCALQRDAKRDPQAQNMAQLHHRCARRAARGRLSVLPHDIH